MSLKIIGLRVDPQPGDLQHPDTIMEMIRRGERNMFRPMPATLYILLEDLNGTRSATKTNIDQMLAYENVNRHESADQAQA